MKRILFLGERRISQQCLAILHSDVFKKQISVESIVTNKKFHDGFLKVNPLSKPKYISNRHRNSDAILKTIKELRIDALVAVQHIWILPEKILDAVEGQAFNLHNAKLPDYKGYNSISHAIIDGKKDFTSTIHWMAPEVDSGDIIVEGTVPIHSNDTALSLYTKTVSSASKIFRDFLAMFCQENINRTPMAKGGKFYSRNDLADQKKIISTSSIEQIDRIVRGSYFPPYPPPTIILGDNEYILLTKTTSCRDYLIDKGFNKSDWD